MRLLPLLLPLARLATARVLGSWANSDASSVRVGSEIGGVDGGMTNGEGSIIERAGRWMVKGQGNGVRMVEGLMKKLGQGVKEEEEEEEAAEQAVKKRAEKRDQKEWQILGLTRCTSSIFFLPWAMMNLKLTPISPQHATKHHDLAVHHRGRRRQEHVVLAPVAHERSLGQLLRHPLQRGHQHQLQSLVGLQQRRRQCRHDGVLVSSSPSP